jgi:hypothetical protein
VPCQKCHIAIPRRTARAPWASRPRTRSLPCGRCSSTRQRDRPDRSADITVAAGGTALAPADGTTPAPADATLDPARINTGDPDGDLIGPRLVPTPKKFPLWSSPANALAGGEINIVLDVQPK